MMFRRKKQKEELSEAKQQLAQAKDQLQEVQAHTPEVHRIARETDKHTKGNGFYGLFREGLKGSHG